VHIVPLADETMALLAQLRRLTGGGSLMFPNVLRPDEPMSDSTLLGLLYRMKLKGKMSGHGVRRLFSTWANSKEFNADAIERQLGHVERNKVRGSYNEYDFIDVRRPMMQAWATWLSEQERAAQNVVPIGQSRHAA
jgi:integrase